MSSLFSQRMPSVLWSEIFNFINFANPHRFLLNHPDENRDDLEISLRVLCKHFHSVLPLPKHLKLGESGPFHRPDLSSLILMLSHLRHQHHIHTHITLPIGQVIQVNSGRCGLSIARQVPLLYSDVAVTTSKYSIRGRVPDAECASNPTLTEIRGRVIVTDGVANVSFSNVQFTNTAGNGLEVTKQARVTCDRCRFVGSSRAGLKVNAGGRVVLKSCQFQDNQGSGALIASDETTGHFENCSWSRNLHGLNCENGCQVVVTGGKNVAFNENKKYGIYAMKNRTHVQVRMSLSDFQSVCGGNGESFAEGSLPRRMDRDFDGNCKGEWGAHVVFDEE